MTDTPGWPTATWPEFVATWRAACATDAILAAWPDAHPFAIAADHRQATFPDADAAPAFILTAPDAAWAKFLQPVPPRHHHNVFAMLMRVPGTTLSGSPLAFAQTCHRVRRTLDIGRWLARGHALPAPATERPSAGPHPSRAGITSRWVGDLHADTAGTRTPSMGRDILCLHTAGSDSRQFHRLMADPRLVARHRLTAFDLPGHGRSPLPADLVPGQWRLTTDRYVALIMDFIRDAGLDRPIVLGASMSGEICLELAYRHPDSFAAIIACEATDRIEGRAVPWAQHPEVDQSMLVPEWIFGLMAPDSPAECAADIWWQYSQGGHGIFAGDIFFYANEWDGRDRVAHIDTTRCPLFLLTGEYDYSCTAEMSEATAAKIPGARFTRMPGLGHFPFAENPTRFADYLLPILDGL